MCALVGHDGVSARRSVLAAARERERESEGANTEHNRFEVNNNSNEKMCPRSISQPLS